MVKPTNSRVKAKAQPKLTAKELLKDKALTQKALQNTANKWADKYNFSGDLTVKGLAESGKSVLLAVDGKVAKSKYLVTGTRDNPSFLSSKALFFAKR